MSEPSDRGEYEQRISRRTLLAAAGVSGVSALAGCSGGDGDSATNESGGGTDGESTEEGSDTATEGTSVVSRTYRNGMSQNPVDLNVNSYNPQNFLELAGRLLHERFVAYSFATDEFQLVALDDLQFDGTTVTLTLRDDLTWDNGEDVTTEDIEVQMDLLEKTSGSIWGYLEDYEIVDEKTFEFHLQKETNPRIIKYTLNNMRVDTPAEIFEEYVDEDAAEVQGFAWEDDVIASGPWSHAEKSRQAWEFERNEEFYAAENVNFDTFLLEKYGGNQSLQQALISGDSIDGVTSLFVPPNIVEELPDNVVENRMPSKWGYGIIFNHDDEHFGQRPVRQAVAHLLNRQQIVDNGGPRTKFPAEVPCGIAPKDQESWLGDAMDDFETYGVDESRTERAAELMREAGYSKSDGTWQDDSGSAVGGEYLSPAGWSDWTTMTNTTVSQLNDFGFDFSISTVPTNDWFTRYSESDFKMGSMYWLPGGARSAFPYFPLRYQLTNTHVGGGHNYEADTEYTITGMGGDGEMTINPLETVNSIARTASDEAAVEPVRRAAWHNHIELPMLSVVGTNGQQWFTNDEWDLPAEDDPSRKVPRPPMWPIHEGKLTATESE
ncbi:ABC transporter substrate-binding protein [Halomicrobium salinisoli]|uniref:ABC transporter substrate-binding protein n=1 Tax=Halomicrobium salinisoli TaxID=2878391 RepID=UPI001CF0C199|nr:ABC transporter substrate-binding protein [Halomicrobium salinisoli]